MSRVTLYSLLGTRVAYPSADFGADDWRSALGVYAFGGISTGAPPVVSSKGFVDLRHAAAQTVDIRDIAAQTVGVRDE